MNIPTYVAGPFYLLIFLGLSVTVTLGAKTLIAYLKERFLPQRKPVRLSSEEPQKKRQSEPLSVTNARSSVQRKRRPVRSIEIDPDNVDRIYVRKSS